MKDLTELFNELQTRTDEGARFYRDIIVNNEYAIDTNIHYSCVIDLGATIGEFSYLVYNQADIIYAVEANKSNYHDLCEYIKKYTLDKIKPFHLGIAGSNGVRKLYEAGGSGGYTILNEGIVVEEVETKTLFTFCKENGIDTIDLLKIDVEGAEGEILKAPDSQDLFLNTVKNIVGEDHGHDTIGIVTKLGFTIVPKGTFTAIKP